MLNPKTKKEAELDLLNEHLRRRQAYEERTRERKLLPLEKARNNRTPIDWESSIIDKPGFLGLRDYSVAVETLVEYIDWTPFFYTWELKGRFPKILKDPELGKEASKLYQDAQNLLNEIIENNYFQPKAVVGFFPANSREDDILIYTDESRSKIQTVFHTLRQQAVKDHGKPNQALSDFIAPEYS